MLRFIAAAAITITGILATTPVSAFHHRARFGQGKRARRVGIVALARKLLVALWRCATHATVPAGAMLKMA